MNRALWCLMLLCAGMASAAQPGPDDMRRLKEQAREYEWYLYNPDNPNPWSGSDPPRRWAAELQPDGSWSDIDYKDQTRDNWKTAEHLKRTLSMADEAAQLSAGAQPDAKLNAATLRAAHYWISHDFRNPNWWQNEIGVPRTMAEILLLMGDAMTPADKAAALKIVDRATFSRTGQNLVWMAGITFRKALVENDAALAQKARDIILAELAVTPREGLQADWSFHQHGPQQQMGNYGLSFATEMAGWARLWRGTALAMPEAKLALLRNFAIKGEAMMRVNAAMDINGCDRQLFPHSPIGKGVQVFKLLTEMGDTDAAHAAEYAAAETAGSQLVGGGTTANVNFFRSDTMVHRRPGFYASVKLCSNRVIGEELVNGENLRGRYMADGATFLYQDSKEYADIFPVWDWRRVPGVTCMASGTSLAPVGKMATDFAGGASDGTYGVEGVDYRRDGVTAKKGWFFLDQGVVCLGAGITGTDVRTSIDQRLADGSTESSAGPLDPGFHPRNGVTWMLQAGEGYLFLQPAEVWAGTQMQEGSWKNVYSTGKAAPVTEDVFSIWIDHPQTPASYAYALLPGMTVQKMQACAAKPPVQILSNTPDIQAIRDPATGVTEALFYKPGALKADNLSISASAPCAVILRPGATSVADPTQKEQSLTMTVNGAAHSLSFPIGGLAGSTSRFF